MVTKKPDNEKEIPPEEELTDRRVPLKRNARCPCSSCRARALIMDLETYRRKIETNLEMKRY